MILGLDVSHHQGAVNFPAAKAAGRDFVVIKATEGVGYTDPNFATYRAQAHTAGLVVGIYHFARDNTPAAEAAYFAQTVGALQPGEFLVLDQEVTHAGGNVPWCTAWLAAVRGRYGVNPLIYMNQGNGTGVTSGDWTQIAKANGLWLAKYDNAPATQTSVNYWGPVAMKQYSDAGSVLGVASTCDVNAFYGTAAQLRAYGQPAPTPAPAPTPPGDDMALTAEEHAWLEDVLRRLQSIHLYGFRPIPADSAKNPVPPWTAGGDLAWLDARQKDVVAQLVRALPASQAPQVDPAALAAALLADEASVAKLGDAIAAGLAKRVGNG